MDNRRFALAAIRGKDCFDRNCTLDRAGANTEVALGNIVGVLADLDRLPAIHIHVPQLALEFRPTGLAFEAFALNGKASLRPAQASNTDALIHVQRRLSIIFLGEQGRLGLECGSSPYGQEVRLVVNQ